MAENRQNSHQRVKIKKIKFISALLPKRNMYKAILSPASTNSNLRTNVIPGNSVSCSFRRPARRFGKSSLFPNDVAVTGTAFSFHDNFWSLSGYMTKRIPDGLLQIRPLFPVSVELRKCPVRSLFRRGDPEYSETRNQYGKG